MNAVPAGTLRDVVVQNTDIVSQITHYITPDTPSDLIKVVLWTTDLLYARELIDWLIGSVIRLVMHQFSGGDYILNLRELENVFEY